MHYYQVDIYTQVCCWQRGNLSWPWDNTVIFKTSGASFLSCLADAMQHHILSCLVLLCLVWSKINYSRTWLGLLAAMVVIGFNNVPKEYWTCTKCDIDIRIYWAIMIWWKLPKPRQSKIRQDQARQDKTRRHPDEVSPGLEKYSRWRWISFTHREIF